MVLRWQKEALARVTLAPGQTWSYQLPLEVQGTPPQTEWSCALLPPAALDADPADPLHLTVRVPSDARAGFGEITYQVADAEGPVRGRILLRIQAPSVPPPPPSPPQPPVTEPVKSPAPPVPGAGSAPGMATTPVPDVPDAADTGPPLKGSYRVDVVRNGVRVPHLTARVEPGRTVSIGKSSSTEGVPDLDLRGEFETSDLEAACSRRQVEVFWSEGRIVVKTVGKYPLKLLGADGQPEKADLPREYYWQPDQVLVLPGKLRLVLKRERS